MCFSAPTLHEAPVVHDLGVTHDIQGSEEKKKMLKELAPSLFHRTLGYAAFCQAWGAILTGMPVDYKRAIRQYSDANQGAMLFTFKISLFADVDAFKREMDEYVRMVSQLTPVVGSESFLPGGIEAKHDRLYRAGGIPLGDWHQQVLETLSRELGVPVPWAEPARIAG